MSPSVRLVAAVASWSFLAAVPASACVKDVQSGDASPPHDTDGDHPPFAACPVGVACGRCGTCSDCDFCFASPKGAPCATGNDCAVSGYWTPFPTCFADPAYNPDAIVVGDAAASVPTPMSPSSSACHAGHSGSRTEAWTLACAVVFLTWRRRSAASPSPRA